MTTTTDPGARRRRGRWASAMVLAAGLGATGLIACSVLIDRNARQCTTSADCTHLSANATCSASGICVAPVIVDAAKDCGPPVSPGDFANSCPSEGTTCVPLDNCQHGLCDNPDASLLPPPDGGAPVTGAGGATGGADAGVLALPSCANQTDRANVIYVTGSSNFPPLLSQLGPLIIKQTGYTPVYQVTSSCNGVKTVFSTAARDHLMLDPVSGSRTATATYVTADGTLVPCSLGAGGVPVDIGESDIFSSSCSGFDEPTGDVGQYFGPIQAMVFVVPGGSSQSVISAEMARAVFGRGGSGATGMPWTDPTYYFVRNANTGTQQMIGRAIGVGAERFWGIDRGTAASLASQLQIVDPSKVELAIGIISSDYRDPQNRPYNIRELAFQGVGQSCGYYPNSTQFLKDKRNVRDGHYPIWGPLHFFTPTSGGLPNTVAAMQFVSTVSVDRPSMDLLNAYVDAGLVPSCAMRVERKRDLGDLSAYQPPYPCGCYFEARLAGGAGQDGCKACVTSNDCKDNPALPACNFGYCEAR